MDTLPLLSMLCALRGAGDGPPFVWGFPMYLAVRCAVSTPHLLRTNSIHTYTTICAAPTMGGCATCGRGWGDAGLGPEAPASPDLQAWCPHPHPPGHSHQGFPCPLDSCTRPTPGALALLKAPGQFQAILRLPWPRGLGLQTRLVLPTLRR